MAATRAVDVLGRRGGGVSVAMIRRMIVHAMIVLAMRMRVARLRPVVVAAAGAVHVTMVVSWSCSCDACCARRRRRIGAAFRIERRFDLDHLGAEPLRPSPR